MSAFSVTYILFCLLIVLFSAAVVSSPRRAGVKRLVSIFAFVFICTVPIFLSAVASHARPLWMERTKLTVLSFLGSPQSSEVSVIASHYDEEKETMYVLVLYPRTTEPVYLSFHFTKKERDRTKAEMEKRKKDGGSQMMHIPLWGDPPRNTPDAGRYPPNRYSDPDAEDQPDFYFPPNILPPKNEPSPHIQVLPAIDV